MNEPPVDDSIHAQSTQHRPAAPSSIACSDSASSSRPAQGTVAQGTASQGAVAQGTAAQGTAAQGTAAQGAAAQGTVAQWTVPQWTVPQWTAAIAGGDEAAFSAFYEQWFGRVKARAERLLRSDPQAVPDIIQEVMLRVARRIPTLTDERAVEAWMARTVFTAAMDRMREERRRRLREHCAAARAEDHARDAAAEVEEREQLRWLQHELAELPDADRALLAARFAGDATFKELGDEFAMTGHAVAGRFRRVLAKLRQRAETWLDG